MSQKWNLQDIRPAAPRQPRPVTRPPHASRPTTVAAPDDIPHIVIEDGRSRQSRRPFYIIAAFALIIIVTVTISAFTGKTVLTVYPQIKEPNINAEFTAYPTPRENALSYTILTLEATGERQVKASGQVEVTETTTGTITIIKNTPGAERLIANTRFRSPDGKIFRISEAVVVPGAIKDGSGATVPGTIQASVTAAEPGESYNLPAKTRFTVPGFQENGFTALYESIYAENTEAFTGGFAGPQYQIDDAELSTARQALQIELRDQLLNRIQTERPAGTIAFMEAVALTYTMLPTVAYGNDLVTLKEQAILQIPLFEELMFGTFLASEAIATYDGGDVRVKDPTVLTFSYTNSTTSASVIANEPSLTFSLVGKPLLVWQFDALKLAKDLATLPKTALNNAITAYPGIRAAKVTITPFWRQSFPAQPENIRIEEVHDPSI